MKQAERDAQDGKRVGTDADARNKVRPYSPLPWRPFFNERWHIAQVATTFDPKGKDAVYIAHAANAYPRLVEFVRQFSALMGPESHIRLDAELFLRELGECDAPAVTNTGNAVEHE